jgi:NitT/TauT family transport system substrate-binding protein
VSLAIGLSLLAAGCQQPGDPAAGVTTGPLERAAIAVGGLPVVDDAPLYLAAARGMFRAAGLNVTITTFSSSAAELQALLSGKIDIAAGSDVTFLQAQASGRAKLQIIADGYEAAPNVIDVLVLPGSGITRPQQLAKATIGTPPAQLTSRSWIKNVEELVTSSALQDDSVDPASMQWRPMPVAQMLPALKHGKVKAIVATEPYIIDAERSLGAIAVLDSCSGATANLPLSGYFTLASVNRADPNTVRAFQQVLNQAQALAAQRGNVQQILPSYTTINAQTAALINLGVYPTSLDADRVQQVADLMYQSGMISQPIVVSSLAVGQAATVSYRADRRGRPQPAVQARGRSPSAAPRTSPHRSQVPSHRGKNVPPQTHS